MYFRFDSIMNDEDYINFNVFYQLNTQEGQLRTRNARIVSALLSLLMCIGIYLTTDSLPYTAFVFVVLLIYLVVHFSRKEQNAAKGTKRAMKFYEKTGRRLYAPHSVMEFTDEAFIETDEGIKTEVLYSIVKKVSILNGRYIFIDVNRNQYFILPFKSFSSNEECNAFIDFLRTRIQNVEFY